jgi:hypothetical protein
LGSEYGRRKWKDGRRKWKSGRERVADRRESTAMVVAESKRPA